MRFTLPGEINELETLGPVQLFAGLRRYSPEFNPIRSSLPKSVRQICEAGASIAAGSATEPNDIAFIYTKAKHLTTSEINLHSNLMFAGSNREFFGLSRSNFSNDVTVHLNPIRAQAVASLALIANNQERRTHVTDSNFLTSP